MVKKLASRLLPKGQFARGVSVLVGGTAVSQLLTVLAIPLITRLYTPEDFGILAAFTAFLAFFTVVSAARYDLTLPLPEKDEDAASLLVLGAGIVAVVTILSAIVFLTWPDEIATSINAPELSKYMWLLPVSIFFGGMYQLVSRWAVRTKEFKSIAKTKVTQTVSLLIVQLGGYTLGPVALLLGHASGQGAGAGSLARSALKRQELKSASLRNIFEQSVRYKQFPIYSTWTALFNTASLQLAPLIFITLFGGAVAGLYALTLRVLSMPISLIGNAIGSVFLSTAPQAHREGRLAILVKELHGKLTLAGALPLMVLLFFGPELFALVFGESWRQAGVYAQWMAPWIYLQFQWSPLSILTTVLELQREALFAQIFTFLSRFGVLMVAWWLDLSASQSVFLFATTSAVVYLLIMLWFTKKAGVSKMEIIAADVKCLSIAMLLVAPVYILVGNSL